AQGQNGFASGRSDAANQGRAAGSFFPQAGRRAESITCAGTKGQRPHHADRRRQGGNAAIHHALLRRADDVQPAVQKQGRPVFIQGGIGRQPFGWQFVATLAQIGGASGSAAEGRQDAARVCRGFHVRDSVLDCASPLALFTYASFTRQWANGNLKPASSSSLNPSPISRIVPGGFFQVEFHAR